MDVLHEVLNSASEVAAEAVDRLGACSVSLLIQDLGEGHAVKTSGRRDFTDADPTVVSELLFLDHLAEFESDHDEFWRQAIKIFIKRLAKQAESRKICLK